jgi:hypothetical protein
MVNQRGKRYSIVEDIRRELEVKGDGIRVAV